MPPGNVHGFDERNNVDLPGDKLTWLLKIAIYSWFTHLKLWLCIVVLVYERVMGFI